MFNSYQSNDLAYKRPELTDAQIKAQAPSIFALEPMSGVSRNYTFLPTSRIVQAMRMAGWAAMQVDEQRVRLDSHRGFQVHVVRFQRRETVAKVGEFATEIALLNSHDRSSTYQLHAGLFRFVCTNGMLVSDSVLEQVSIRHSRNSLEQVIEASLKMSDALSLVAEHVAAFRARQLTAVETKEFAKHATRLRWPVPRAIPLGPEVALAPRRAEDVGTDLWNVLNRVQENVLRGGLRDIHRRTSRGKLFRRTTNLRSIDENIRINRSMWELAENVRLGNLPSFDE